MKNQKDLEICHNSSEPTVPRIQLLLYLVPVLGFFPSLWTLYWRQGSREHLAVCRLSITLALGWLAGYVLLTTGAETSNFLTLRLSILNTFLTSSYFVATVWLMVRLARGKSARLPFFSRLADDFNDKHLS